MRKTLGSLFLIFCLFIFSGCVMFEPQAPVQRVASERGNSIPAASTPSPTPEPEETESSELQYGSTGSTVRRLQERLMDLGYLDRAEATDFFDIETEAALKIFQKQVGLDVTGTATISTLTRILDPAAPPKATPEPGIDDVPVPKKTLDPETAGMSYESSADVSAQPITDVPVRTGLLSGKKIGIDPGHQLRGNSTQEPVAPGSSQTKAKVSSGTQGVASGVAEYVVNLAVGLKLRDLLVDQGAEVIMTRDTNDVDISNSERARMLNDAEVDLAIRLHCDGEDDPSRNGAFVLVPAGEYTTAIQAESRAAAEDILAGFVAATGAKDLGVSERSDQTGFNWSTVPVVTIEMGHMSNAEEDMKLTRDDYQDLCALGIQQGITEFFS